MERLSLKVEKINDEFGNRVRVGNSGLVIWHHVPDSRYGHLDYMPESHSDAVLGKECQYALTFLGALDAALNEHKNGNEIILPDKIQVTTNPRMARFIENNLRPAAQELKVKSFHSIVVIDTERLVQSEEILDNLSRAHDLLLCKQYKVRDPQML